MTTFDCSIRAAWVVPPVYPDSCLDASVAVRTCTAITDLKQTPSQQSLDQMYSYHFRYHTSSGYSLHWFRFKWSLHQIKWFYLLLLHPDTFKVAARRSWKSLRFAVPQSLFPFCYFHALPAAMETFWFHHVTMWSSSKQHRTQSNLGKTWKNKNRKTLDLQKSAKVCKRFKFPTAHLLRIAQPRWPWTPSPANQWTSEFHNWNWFVTGDSLMLIWNTRRAGWNFVKEIYCTTTRVAWTTNTAAKRRTKWNTLK